MRRTLKVRAICVIAALTLLIGAKTASATLLDFDSILNVLEDFNTISEDGFDVVGSGPGTSFVLVVATNCNPECPENGTSYLFSVNQSNQSGPTDTFTITAQDSSAFSLVSFDGAEAHQGLTDTWAEEIQITGVQADSSTIVQTFMLDFVQDGSGPLIDFQSFAVSGLTNVVSLTFAGVGIGGNFFSLDNIELSAITEPTTPVPEPTTLALFATGLAGLGFMMRRRRSTSSLSLSPV